MAHVVLYAQKPGRLFCDRTEEFLREMGVEPSVRNVIGDEEAMVELEGLGTMTTPVTVVGEEVIIDFDRERLARVIGLERP